jgi:hypothetical protein
MWSKYMYRSFSLAACSMLLASTAFAVTAAKVDCAKSPATKWQPQAALIAKLKAEGTIVSKIKVENGCYETYAKDKTGKKANAAYNAETLEMLDNAEGGEVVKKK